MRYRLDVAYFGKPFQGWQIQPNTDTVQGDIEKALFSLFKKHIRLIGAGRTDAGVHARQQVAHFDVEATLDEAKTLHSLNALTSRCIRMAGCVAVGDDFHARFSPHIKTYAYYFDAAVYPDPFTLDTHYHTHGVALDFARMREFLAALVGTHDFASFCSVQNSSETTVRTLNEARLVLGEDEKFKIELLGKGFLQHMVRIIASTCFDIGTGKRELAVALAALGRNDARKLLGATFPAHGLCLESTVYGPGVVDEMGQGESNFG